MTSGDVAGLEIALDDVVVQEIWPAVYDNVSPGEIAAFTRNVLGLDTGAKVYDFGKE